MRFAVGLWFGSGFVVKWSCDVSTSEPSRVCVSTYNMCHTSLVRSVVLYSNSYNVSQNDKRRALCLGARYPASAVGLTFIAVSYNLIRGAIPVAW